MASFAATLVFEGLKVHATNIIMKSGYSDDNPEGNLCVHVLPRMQDDGLNKSLLWEPKQPSYDLDSVMKKIKDNTWNIKYLEEKKEVKKVEDIFVKPEVIKLTNSETSSHEDEIKNAIERISN